MQAKGNPYDSHPPLSQRLLAAAAVADANHASAEGPMAITLLEHVDALEGDLLAHQTGNAEVARFPSCRWEDQVAQSVELAWEEFTIRNGRRLPRIDVGQLAAQHRELAKFGAMLAAAAPPAVHAAVGGQVLGLLLGRALLRAGWRVETSLGEAAFVVHGDARLDPLDIGRALALGELGEPQWVATCAQHGIATLRLAGPDLVLG
jgi:hypothetical protein